MNNRYLTLMAAALALTVAGNAAAIDTTRPEIGKFIEEMVAQHGFDRERLTAILASAESQPRIIESISKPAERTLTWGQYRNIFMTPERVTAGAEFWREHRDALMKISDDTGVAPEILVGIIGVETYFGRITGNYRVLDALVTLSFDYPPRSRFFRRELEQFLLLTDEEQMDPAEATGSYAGAMGAPQFMPSSYRAYAVDASHDGKRDIWSDWQDVIGSVANYFLRHGWERGGDIVSRATLADSWHGSAPDNSLETTATVDSLSSDGVLFATDLAGNAPSSLLKLDGSEGDEYWVGFHNFFVITRYNRSVMYALAVVQLGRDVAAEVEHDAK